MRFNIRYLFLQTAFLLFISTAFGQLKADFSVNHTSGCSPAILLFSDNSTGSPTAWAWDFGNGVTSTLQNPGVTYSTGGKYTVKLTVSKGAATSTESKTAYIEIFDSPKADFSSDINSGCAPLSVKFTDKSVAGSASINSWVWDFGDGNTSSSQSPSHSYTNGGTYRITLIVKDKNGCTGTLIKNAFINVGQPAAGFTASKTYACSAPLSVSFTDTTRPAAKYTYAWDFGDGKTSTSANPTHTYTAAGSYKVSLKVTDPNGCTDSKSINNYITIGSLKAGFSWQRKDSCLPVGVDFTNTSIPNLAAVSYLWDFGDGGSSLSKDPGYVYQKGGTYAVKLIIHYGSSCTDTITKKVTIPDGPKAAFSADVNNHCKVSAAVKFTDLSTNAASWSWDFGDGSTSTSQSPSHSYASFGNYDVKLIIKSKSGCVDTLIKPAFIKVKKPVFGIIATPEKGCKPLKVAFKVIDSSLVPITKWSWDLGDGNTSTAKNPTETYNDSGVYLIKLTGTTANGCSTVLSDTIKVGIPPRAKFTANKFIGCRDQMNVQFTDLTNDTTIKANEWLWDFGDKKTSSLENPTHIYSDTGFFTVKLTSYFNGCPSTTLTKTNYIYIYPPVALTEDTFVSCQGATVQFTNKSIGDDSWLWDFGDGNTSGVRLPSHKYSSPGIYNARLTVYHKTNTCSSKKNFIVVVTKARPIYFHATDTAVCSPLSTSFYSDTKWAKSLFWDFGDGNVSNDSTPSNTYLLSGSYTVKLTVNDSFGCTYSLSKPKYISAYGGNANFGLAPAGGCLPMTVTVKDISNTTFPATKRTWYMGNGESFDASGKDTSYTYHGLPVNYIQKYGLSITLVLEDAHGCTYLRSRTVKPSMPLPQFTIVATKKCGYDSVTFYPKLDDTTVIKPYKVKWDFGNSQFSTLDTPTITLKGKADLTIKMVLTDNNGCKDSLEQAYKLNTSGPKANFGTSNLPTGCPPVVVHFTDSTKAGGAGIKSYFWAFGDGTNAKVATPSKTYTLPGKYDVSLLVTDSTGCTNQIIKKDFVTISGPDGSYTIDKTRGCSPLSVAMDGKSVKATQFVWDMGDGAILKGASVKHTYAISGVFHPHLRVTDSAGCEVELPEKDSIIVYALPKPAFKASQPNACPGQQISFQNLSSSESSISQWKWYFGDGDSSTLQEPTHIYTKEGNYTVSLYAQNVHGCDSQLVKANYINVKIDTTAPVKPIIYRTSVQDNQQALLEYNTSNDSAFGKYEILRQLSPTPEALIKNIITKTDTIYYDNGDARLQSYCYRVAVMDQCGNISYSPKHCTVELKAFTDTAGIRLRWTPYIGWKALNGYEVYRRKTNTIDYTKIGQTDNASLNYIDKDVSCQELCYYKIKAIEQGGYAQLSWSDTAAARAGLHSKVGIIDVKRVTVDSDYVLVEWDAPSSGGNNSYQIERSLDGIRYSFLVNLPAASTSLQDKQVDVANISYYYHIRLVDPCTGVLGNAGKFGRSIVLKAENKSPLSGQAETPPRLSWNPYSFWDNGVSHYEIELLNTATNKYMLVGQSDSITTHFYHQDLEDYQNNICYRVNAYKYGQPDIYSRSNIACLKYTGQLYAPNAFSPQGNNLNDTFFLKGYLIKEYKLQIYNRWGEMVFESNDIHKGWDGTFRGEMCEEGIYMYVCVARPQNSFPILKKGTITLIR